MRDLFQAWFARLLRAVSGVDLWRWTSLALGLILLGLFCVAVWQRMTGGKADAVASRLDAAMASAGARNASDAVGAVQARANSEKAMERSVSDAQSAIEAASDMAGADAAGRNGLCAIFAGFCAASRVQQSHSR